MPKIYKRNCNYCGEYYVNCGVKFCSKICSGKYYSGKNSPQYGKKLSEEAIRKMSEVRKGIKFTKNHKKKLSEVKKNLFKEGKLIVWNKGLTKETNKVLKKLSEKLKGRKFPERSGKNHVDWKEKPTCICKRCKNVFIGRLNKKNIFCSKSCGARWLNKRGMIGKHFKKGIIPWNKGKPFLAGKKNPNWRGGKSFEPYSLEFNKDLKRLIRKRDNHTCQECNFTEKQLGYTLHIHHIDYNKKKNNQENLISLCRSCHLKANYSREDWTEYFQGKVI